MANEPTGVSDDRLRVAADPNIPQIYFNGFANALTIGDITAVLERNGRPVAVLNMSFTVAKTFAQKLGQMVSALEEKAGREMLTTDDIGALAAALAEQQKDTK